jgi:hypothetical protein
MMEVSIQEIYGSCLIISSFIFLFFLFNFISYIHRKKRGSIDYSKTFSENFFKGIMP